ncbi:MAG: fasciclin domain-containing protein [Balneolaceae bacterium]
MNTHTVNSLKKSVLTLLFLFAFTAGAVAQESVFDVINDSDDHTIFAELLAEAELHMVISEPGPFTVMAPTDEAFEELGDELTQLRQNPDMLQNILIGHLFQGEVPAADAAEHLGIEVETGDIPAANGLVHSIDTVMIQ